MTLRYWVNTDVVDDTWSCYLMDNSTNEPVAAFLDEMLAHQICYELNQIN